MPHECEKVGLEFFESAPTLHQATVQIDATPEDVFDAFLDADAWVEWAMPITGVEWTSDFPLEAGSTRTVHMKGGMVGYEEFLVFEPGRRMAFRFNEASKPMGAFAEDYQVTDLGDGHCQVQWTMAMDTGSASGPRSKIMDPVMGLMVRRMLRKFGRLVERRAAT